MPTSSFSFWRASRFSQITNAAEKMNSNVAWPASPYLNKQTKRSELAAPTHTHTNTHTHTHDAHNGEEEREGDSGEERRVSLLVSRNTVRVDHFLEHAREFVRAEVRGRRRPIPNHRLDERWLDTGTTVGCLHRCYDLSTRHGEPTTPQVVRECPTSLYRRGTWSSATIGAYPVILFGQHPAPPLQHLRHGAAEHVQCVVAVHAATGSFQWRRVHRPHTSSNTHMAFSRRTPFCHLSSVVDMFSSASSDMWRFCWSNSPTSSI